MIMKTEKLTIELVLSTKKIVKLTSELKGKNLSELYFKALSNADPESLAYIINAFGENEGKNPFNNDLNKVYDFIDDYKKENKKTYEDIFVEIAEVINAEGFFHKKMTKEEMEQLKQTSLFNMDETMKSVVDKVAFEMVSNEFKGHQG
jgi:hypothetical protein